VSSTKISISLPPDVLGRLKFRQRPGEALSTLIALDLQVCWHLLEAGEQEGRGNISADEGLAVVDALRDVTWDHRNIRAFVYGDILPVLIAQACKTPGFEKAHKISGKALARKIQKMSLPGKFALLDNVKTVQPFYDKAVREAFEKKRVSAAAPKTPRRKP